MFRLTAPPDDEVRRFIANQEHARFTYPEVGASADTVPAGYNVDHNRIELGRGERVWQRAVVAVRAWQMFNIPWLCTGLTLRYRPDLLSLSPFGISDSFR
jgi:Domain of unknown function (DUF1990)